MDVFTNLIMAICSLYIYKITVLYILNLYNVKCPLYLNTPGKNFKIHKNIDVNSKTSARVTFMLLEL